MPRQTHYQVLGIDHTATVEQIRRAYRAAAKAHHPDVNAAADAQARFAGIAAAYEVLSDRRKRSAYDLSLKSAGGNSDPRKRSQAPAENRLRPQK